MAGIYIHIPFCKGRCIYCDFFSTTSLSLKKQYIGALCEELRMRVDYLKGASVETIYFGGGTPSLLDEEDFRQVFRTIEEVYGMDFVEEVTLEVNPDDVTEEYVAMLRSLPFNRISMGVQTFDDATLKLLKRRHHAAQAIEAVGRCRQAGFDNISIDLIYGLPGETDEHWMRDLEQAVSLDVEHLSAYHLTYEEGTPIYDMLKVFRLFEVDEESSIGFFSTLIDKLEAAGYEHYEISNFAKPGMYSRHNASYWKGVPYLGCGPSAHSFNGCSRASNVSSLEKYMRSVEKGEPECVIEERDPVTCYNECVMTSMRTKWGVPMEYVRETFGADRWQYCMDMAEPYLKSGKLEMRENHLRLTREGIFISDSILRDLIFVDAL